MHFGILLTSYCIAILPVTGNDATPPCPDHCLCFVDPISLLDTVECSKESIRRIPTGIPSTTQALYIHDANVKTLHAESFLDLPFLEKLHLLSDSITYIQPGAFQNLTNLTELYLSGNKLRLTNDVYVPGLFRGLENLLELRLNYNSEVQGEDLAYPDFVWSDLPSLKFLTIDGLYQNIFPHGFSKLKNLSNLTLSGNKATCNVANIYNNTFSAFADINLKYLDLSECGIQTVEPFALAPLKSISTLVMSFQKAEFIYLRNIFYGLQNTAIITLDVTNFCRSGSNFGTRELIDPLKATNLKHIILDDNQISWIDSGAILGMPNTLEEISLLGNYIIGSPWSLYSMISLPKLKVLKLSIIKADWGNDPLSFYLPNNLEQLVFSGMHTKSHLPILKIHPFNKLQSLSWTDSTIVQLFGFISGLNNLRNLSFTVLQCNNISKGYFKFMPELQSLNLSGNYLNNILSVDYFGEQFLGLEMLSVLDLSDNVLKSLASGVFSHVKHLKQLILKRNSIFNFDVQLGHLIRLDLLDLSTNSLTFLGDSIVSNLDPLMNSNNLKIDLRDNPLICSCDTLQFLRWMQEKKGHFMYLTEYVCSYQNNLMLLTELDNVIYDLSKSCILYGVVISLTSAIIAIFFGILLAGMIYRYRLHLMYMFHTVRLSMQTTVLQNDREFKFDAFVSYAEADEFPFVIDQMVSECEEKRKLKLCIHRRDFMPGTPITDNIVGAIKCSRKSVFVLSREFLQSEWCRYEFNMARMEHIYSGRQTMIIVMYEDICGHELPLEILEAMKAETFLAVKNYQNDAFWELLVRAINGDQI